MKCFIQDQWKYDLQWYESFKMKFHTKLKMMNSVMSYLCIPALSDAEYLQSVLGTLGCKREKDGVNP